MTKLRFGACLKIAFNLILTTTFVSCLSLAGANAKDFYVSPNGGPDGKGKFIKPWDLQTALNQPNKVKSGDTIWLRGGNYTGMFTSNLNGAAATPIIVRQYPGERAILDRAGSDPTTQPVLTVRGSWVWFWGLEIMNSYKNRSRTNPSTGTVKLWRGNGIDVYAPNNKFINMVFHDNGSGIWDKQDGTEIYGCLFYFNGNNKFEHGMYIGNSSTTNVKYVTDNLVFDNAGMGIQSYSGSSSSAQTGIHIEGNAVFNNGAITLDDQISYNIVLYGEVGIPAADITVANNYVYCPISTVASKNQGIQLGYADQGNRDLHLLDNYIIARIPLQVYWWQYVESHGNTIYTQNQSIFLKTPSGVSTSAYRWDHNTYISGISKGPVFTLMRNNSLSLASWQSLTGLDSDSKIIQSPSLHPRGVKILVRSNKYEAGRGHIIVFNWDHKASVTVDISRLGLQVGDRYEIRDAQNYFRAPVVSGSYDGNSLQLPMNLTQVATPVGNVERVPVHTAPEFAAFVIYKL